MVPLCKLEKIDAESDIMVPLIQSSLEKNPDDPSGKISEGPSRFLKK
jgi:hypothetical protein